MDRYNPSAWAIKHPQLTVFLILSLLLSGVQSYIKLGRSEEPPFTLKTMMVRTLWPGATARETEQQLTDRVEKRLQTLENIDHIKSYSKPGESTIFVILKDSTPQSDVKTVFQHVRNKLQDVASELPQGALGPFPNDDFADVYVSIFALTGDGVDLADLRRYADQIVKDLRQLPGIKKVDLFGAQDEKVYIDIPLSRLAQMDIAPATILDSLRQQNNVSPSGFIETNSDRIQIRVSGDYNNLEAIRATSLSSAGHLVRLDSIANISRGLSDPPSPLMRVANKDAIGIGISMERGGDVLAVGERLHVAMEKIKATTPRGIEFHTILDQPKVVRTSVSLFMRSFSEAVAIVLAVSFVSLGWRTGSVVALSIPLVLSATFVVMRIIGTDLHMISFGALIISLGLLVDDAIIAVEIMVVRIEQGFSKLAAATYAYTSTAKPMLFGTLVTVAAFMPAGLAKSSASEYSSAIFWVIATSLPISWLVAVLFTPFIGYYILDVTKLRPRKTNHENDIYSTSFYLGFRRLLIWCLYRRSLVIATTILCCFCSIGVLAFAVEKQFFPNADHLEVVVDLRLPDGSSLKATRLLSKKLEATLNKDPAVERYTGYIGSGSPRFQLSQSLQLENTNLAEYIVVAKDRRARDDLVLRLRSAFADPKSGFGAARARANIFKFGPPMDYQVAFRVFGPDIDMVKKQASRIAEGMRSDSQLYDVHDDWSNMSKGLRLVVDDDKARSLGVSRQRISDTFQAALNGTTVSQMREGDQLIDIVWRGDGASRATKDLENLPVPSLNGRNIPLGQMARLEPMLEHGVIWRWDRQPCVTVLAEIQDNVQAATVTERLTPILLSIASDFPPGYHFETAGLAEEAGKGVGPILEVAPWVFLIILTLLMIQLQSFSRVALVLCSAPLGLIGVAIALVISGRPYGFVANLGVIALFGMIIRNSVILVDQIDQDLSMNKPLWDAIVDSTVRRFRPIALTAAAAVLGMLPLAQDAFWGPMAIAIMGGLAVATVLTCFSLPALYAAWYRVQPPANYHDLKRP